MKTRRRCTALVSVIVLLLSGTGVSAAAPPTEESGSLDDLARSMDGAVVGVDTERFARPDDFNRTLFSEMVREFRGAVEDPGKLPSAGERAAAMGYRLGWYGANTTRYLLLNESAGPTRGWGSLIANPAGNHKLVVEIPHPVSDAGTTAVGLKLFAAVGAGWAIVAGAHEYANRDHSADPVSNHSTPFHAAHRVLAAPGATVVQVHGFSVAAHPGYPEVVLSSGMSEPRGLISSIAGRLRDRGFTAGVFDGVSWADLGAQSNIQAAATRSAGGEFVHVEMERAVREDGGRLPVFLEAFKAGLSEEGELMAAVRAGRAVVKEGSEGYRFPSEQERASAAAAGGAIAGALRERSEVNLLAAARRMEMLGFNISVVDDSGRRIVLLREAGTVRGWGMYGFDPSGDRRVLVEAPRAVGELGSRELAVRTFLTAGAGILLLSTSHWKANRDGSADVALNGGSIFAALHEALATRGTTTIQFTGFSHDIHAGYPDAVVSSGTSVPGPAARAVADGLRRAGLATGLYDGRHWAALSGKGNIQGQSSREAGGEFALIHLDEKVRGNSTTTGAVASAIGAVRFGAEAPPAVEPWTHLAAIGVLGGFAVAGLVDERRRRKGP